MNFKFLLLCSLVVPFMASAKMFTNSYVSFQLPPNWDCRLEVTEWICTSKYNKKSKEAIIVLTAKEIGPADNNSVYYAHLKKPKAVPLRDGKQGVSKVYQVKQQRINHHVWVDGLHLGSEVQHYYTRYLATVKPPVAVLVTFSAHQKYYTQYSADFMKAIQSLRVTASKNLLTSRGTKPKGIGNSSPFGPPVGDGTMVLDMGDIQHQESEGESSTSLYLGLAILILAGVGYFLVKRKG